MIKLFNKKGMTLVEIMVAFALLAILISGFLMIFSSSLVNILNFGSKSKAFATANQAMEAVYSIDGADASAIEAELNSRNGNKVLVSDGLSSQVSGKDFNYFIEATSNGVSDGFQVSIEYFYGNRSVTLVSYVKGSD